jgi:molybdopterin adenylyltransferase
MNVGVLTISDRVSRGEREDIPGEDLRAILQEQGWQTICSEVVPDDQHGIEIKLIEWCDRGDLDLILSTGGTGFSPRDLAPEATLAVIERQAPGLAEAVRAAGLLQTPHAMLSRAVAGIRGRTLIVNLPGNPRAVRENMQVLLPVLPHAVDLLKGDPGAEAGHRKT